MSDSENDHHHRRSLKDILFSTDHKIIGFQYTITGMLMALIGGYMAYVFRMQLAHPGEAVPGFGLVTPMDYNALVTNHGTIMIFWVAMPVLIAGFGNFLIPLMIGCDDMVFPRVNRLSFQIFFISALVLIASFFVDGGGFGGAWTSYPPLSAKSEYNLTPAGDTIWLVAVALEFVAFLLGGINFVTTVMNSRAKGMKMHDIPMVVWMIIIASILFMVSVGPLVAGAVMLGFDQVAGTHFYDPFAEGDPLLWQHLFWFFGHPEVYVVLLPAMGVVAEILCVFSRKKLFGYKTLLYSTFATGILSFVVWAHHQFVAGIDPRMAHLFTVTTLLISIPIAEMVFLYIATLYGGSIEFKTPMLWAIAFVAEFLIGGVTGIYLGSSGTDIYYHDSYFVVAHFHYTFVPIAIISVFAGITYWYPKATGRMMSDFWGKVHFWGTIIAFNCIHPLVPARHGRATPPDLQLRTLPGTGPAGTAGDARLRHRLVDRDDHLPDPVSVELHREPVQGSQGGEESMARQHARMVRRLPAAARQLGRAARMPSAAVRVQRARSRRGLLAAKPAELNHV